MDFDGETLISVETRYDDQYDPYLILGFNDKGKETLKNITSENKDDVVGIFVGNQLITSFTVKKRNDSGTLKVLKPAKTKGADELKNLFLTQPLPLPIILQESEQV